MNQQALATPQTAITQNLGYNNLSGLAKWEAKREVDLAVKGTMVAAVHEQGRALITNMALESVGALSSLEEHLCEVAPTGAHRYRHIVDAYAAGAAQMIARW
jgi:hypothetical protein